MSKEIDINNEEQILKECDFDYYYNSEVCSSELCMFFNDLCNKEFMNVQFNNSQAKIDLGRIGITLNKQFQKISDLEAKLAESEEQIWALENQKLHAHNCLNKLKQQLAEKDQAIESLQEINQSLGQTCNNDAKEIERLREQLAEKDGELHQIYSHLGVEAFGEDIHEQALKEIANRENQYNQLILNSKYTNEEMIDFAVEQLENVKDKTDALMLEINNMNYFIMVKEELYDTLKDKVVNCTPIKLYVRQSWAKQEEDLWLK